MPPRHSGTLFRSDCRGIFAPLPKDRRHLRKPSEEARSEASNNASRFVRPQNPAAQGAFGAAEREKPFFRLYGEIPSVHSPDTGNILYGRAPEDSLQAANDDRHSPICNSGKNAASLFRERDPDRRRKRQTGKKPPSLFSSALGNNNDGGTYYVRMLR